MKGTQLQLHKKISRTVNILKIYIEYIQASFCFSADGRTILPATPKVDTRHTKATSNTHPHVPSKCVWFVLTVSSDRDMSSSMTTKIFWGTRNNVIMLALTSVGTSSVRMSPTQGWYAPAVNSNRKNETSVAQKFLSKNIGMSNAAAPIASRIEHASTWEACFRALYAENTVLPTVTHSINPEKMSPDLNFTSAPSGSAPPAPAADKFESVF